MNILQALIWLIKEILDSHFLKYFSQHLLYFDQNSFANVFWPGISESFQILLVFVCDAAKALMGLSDEHFYGSWERGSLNIMMIVRLSLFFFNWLGCLKCRSVALGQPENNTKHITLCLFIGQLLDLS